MAQRNPTRRFYRAKAQSWDWGKTGTGKPQLVVNFTILQENVPERSLPYYGVISDNTKDRVIESMMFMGWDGETDPADVANLHLDANEVELLIEDEEVEVTDNVTGEVSTKAYARVQFINQLGKLNIKNRMDDDELKGFASEMKMAARALVASKGGRRPGAPTRAAPAQPAQPEPPPLSEEDMPF